MKPEDKARVQALIRRVNKARRFPKTTCPASRHLQIMAECMLKGGYPMLTEEPEHCAESILAVVASLWESRNADGLDAGRFRYLQSLKPVQAQQYFWNFKSRKQRAAEIDADKLAQDVADFQANVAAHHLNQERSNDG